MKKYFLLGLSLIFVFSQVNSVGAISHVNGYIKKNGTYVAPHYKTSPNTIKFDNWSSKGNSNPFSGKKGYKKW